MRVKLIGSRTEQKYRTELLASREKWFGERSDSLLKQILLSKGYDATKAIVIGWTPDQCEDIFSVLILPDQVISVEIDRVDDSVEPIIETGSLESWLRGLTQIGQIKLAVALDILNNP